MHRRYDDANVPTEVLRTFIAVTECDGNFSKAASSLGLTQPAVSAQIKRLEQVIGNPLLVKSSSGARLTEFGSVVLVYARRIVGMNDQLLSHSKPHQPPNQLRIGMPRWVPKRTLVEVIKRCSAAYTQGKISFCCANLEDLEQQLSTDRVDMALLCDVVKPPGLIFEEWWEQLYWVKSRHLKLKPGAPIPFVSWPGSSSDRHATRAFNDAGIQYFTSFTAPDLPSRVAAVTAGLGVMILSAGRIIGGVEVAKERYFPTLPAMRKGLYIRAAVDVASVEAVARAFVACIRPPSSLNVVIATVDKQIKPNRAPKQRAVRLLRKLA
jgi:DNA-binding transcriptional LysR family regulator